MTTRFDMRDLRQWEAVGSGEVRAFELPANGFRHVTFEVMADDDVAVHAMIGSDVWPVAFGAGLMEVSLSVQEPVSIAFLFANGAQVRMRTQVQTQVIAEPVEPSFTSIEPRPSGEHAEVKRMMHVMRLNQIAREKQLLAEVQRLHESGPPSARLANPPLQPSEVIEDDNAETTAPVVPPVPAKGEG